MLEGMSEYMPERMTSRWYARIYVGIKDQGGDRSKKRYFSHVLVSEGSCLQNSFMPSIFVLVPAAQLMDQSRPCDPLCRESQQKIDCFVAKLCEENFSR